MKAKKGKSPAKLGGRKVYIAGPMSGYPEFNFPAFHEAAHRMRGAGYEVVNPAEMDAGDTGHSWEYYLRRDLPEMLKCDLIAVLDGWEKSRGANLEVATARAVGIEVLRYQPHPDSAVREAGFSLIPLDETILDEAKRLTGGDRNRDYGHPLDDFSKTAAMWTPILGVNVTAEQVGLCMVAVKISRQLNAPKRDNLVDGAGYFRTVEMIQEERERRKRGDFPTHIMARQLEALKVCCGCRAGVGCTGEDECAPSRKEK